MTWIHGTWNDKEAYWLELNDFLTVVIRSNGYSSDSNWKVRVHCGSMSDYGGTFKRSELERAKEAGLRFAKEFVAELA